MSGDSPCLLVVGILEGRHFPKLNVEDAVYVEAKFGSKSLSTDPVPAQGKPSFNCELGFELLRKDLQLHRLQRTPVKLQLFIRGPSSMGLMSPLGQIVLDLKQAKESPSEPVWFPVLHCKHRGNRPEILISFYLESAKRNIAQVIVNRAEQPSVQPADQDLSKSAPQSVRSSRSGSPDLRLRTQDIPIKDYSNVTDIPISVEEKEFLLNKNGDYYIYNADGDVGQIFRLTVTLVFAERLEKLNLASTDGPYCFLYYLLGNQVYSEPFQQLEKPDFPAERATVRIKALQATLSQFISKLQHLDVFLVSQAGGSSKTIGRAKVPLLSLLTNGVAEGIYSIGEQTENTPLQDSPCVGLSVTMQREESENMNASSDPESHKTTDEKKPGTNSGDNSHSKTVESSKPGSSKQTRSKSINENSSSDGSTIDISSSQKSGTASYNSVSSSVSKQGDSVKAPVKKNSQKEKENSNKNIKNQEKSRRDKSEGNGGKERPVKSVNSDKGMNNTGGQSTENDERFGTDSLSPNKFDKKAEASLIDVLTHFCLGVDLRSVRFLVHQSVSSCFVQYSYPFVGTMSHSRTSTFPTDLQKKIITDGQNMFCFVTSFARLREAFARLPLTLELMSDNNTNIGLAHVYLEPLLNAPTTFFTQSEHVKGHRSSFACEATFMNRESPAIAEISVFLSLDRLDGKADSRCVTRLQPSFSELNTGIHSSFPTGKHLRQPTEPELRVALELEVWREQQEELFRIQLKKREEEHLSVLAQEWKERDAEREALLKTRITECLRLEEKLRRALFDIEGREVKVRKKEEWLQQQEITLKRNIEDFERRKKEQEIEKVIQLEKQSNEKERVQQAKILSLEKELQQTKDDLQKALSSKSKYKRMWGSTLKDLVIARNLSSTTQPQISQLSSFPSTSTARLETEPKSIINEQRALLEKEKFELKNIQDEVKRLKEDSQLNAEISNSIENTSSTSLSRVDSEYLQGLVEEREMLLRTGSYTTDSRVIQQLDRHIQIAKSSM